MKIKKNNYDKSEILICTKQFFCFKEKKDFLLHQQFENINKITEAMRGLLLLCKWDTSSSAVAIAVYRRHGTYADNVTSLSHLQGHILPEHCKAQI